MLSVLYVDDEPAMLDICCRFLEREEFIVTTCSSGQGALALLESSDFDGLISDYQMPGMDGLELLRRVRTHGPDLPYLLFTGRGREEVVIRAFELGADSYVQKGGDPFVQFAELAHKTRKAIQQHRAERARKMAEADLRTANEHLAAMEAEVRKQYEDLTRSEEHLRVSKERLTFALDAGAIGLFDWSIAIDRAYCSERYRAILGLDPGEGYLSKEEWLSHVHPDDLDRTREALDAVVAGRAPYDLLYRVVRPDRPVVWISSRAEVVRDADGRPARLVGVVVDVTAEQEARNALVRSEERLATLMASLPGMVFRCRNDRDWTMEFVSGGALSLTGYPPSSFLEAGGVAFNALIHPEDRERVWEEIQAALGEDAPYRIEYRVVDRGGTIRRVWEQGRATETVNGLMVEGIIFEAPEGL